MDFFASKDEMALRLRTKCPKLWGMSKKPKSFRDVIRLWGDNAGARIAMASELSGATPTQVSKWLQRDSIPSEWWLPLLSTEKAKAAGVTADLLTALAAREEARA